MLLVSLLDDVCEFLHLVLVTRYQLLGLRILGLLGLQRGFDSIDLLLGHCELVMLVGQSLILSLDLILQLSDLVRRDLELSLELSDLVLRLNQVLAVEVTVTTHGLIQVLLLFQLSFELDILLLEL